MDFWIEPAYTDMSIDVLMSPEQAEEAVIYFRDLQYTFIQDDLQK